MPEPYKQDVIKGPEVIPEEGYVLAPDERFLLASDLSGSRPDGYFKVEGRDIPYKDIVGIRVGGEETFTDLDVIAVPKNGGSYKEGSIFVRSRDPNHVSSTPIPLASIEGGGIIGRNSGFFTDLPDTVSRTHVRLFSDTADKLDIQNLSPTNKTILFRTDSKPKPVRPDDPKEMAATRAIDPLTGESVAGSTVNADNPSEIIDPSTGKVIQSPDDNAKSRQEKADEEQRRHRQRRLRAARQLGQMRLY